MQDKSIKTHTRRQHAMFWVVALVVIVGGVILTQRRYLGSEWMSRAGCLVVVIGIWSGMGNIIQERVLIGRLHMRRRIAKARMRRNLRARKAKPEDIAAEIEKIDKRFEEQADALSDELRLSLGLLEVSLLIAGTLLWGFGDLLQPLISG